MNLQLYKVLSECNEILVRVDDERELAQQICDAIVTTGGFDAASMGLLKDNVLDINVGSGILKPYMDKIIIRIDDLRHSSGATGRALKDGKTHIYNDAKDNPDYDAYKEIIEATSLRSNLAVPLVIDGKIIGALSIYSKIPNIFSEDEKRIFEELAGDLSYGISDIRSKKRIEHLNDMLKRIGRVNQLIAREDNIDNLINGFCENLYDANLYHGITILYKGKIHCYGECCENMKKSILSGELKLDGCEDFRIIDYKCSLHPESVPVCLGIRNKESLLATSFMCVRKEVVEDPQEVSLLKEVAGDLGVGLDNILNRSDALRFGKIVQNLSEGVHTFDPDTLKFDLVNTSALRRLGYTLDEMRRMTPADIKPEFTFSQLIAMFEPLKRHEVESVRFETVHRRKDGSTYPVELRVFLNDDAVNPSYVVIATDITQKRIGEQKIQSLVDALVVVISDMVEVKDPYTAGHQRRVSALAAEIAKELGLDASQIKAIKTAGLLHDIGKISIPLEILTKPSKLKSTEFELIKDHVEEGYKILKRIPDFEEIAVMVRQHHERCNGSGYPLGIKKDEITLGGKILAVSDVVEAMASHRPYRPALGVGKALEEISTKSGILYDPDTVMACERIFEKGWTFDV
jgi:PAS domain S-box-containing protein/putative nucleotidyltransferase with HDIG domain